MPGTAVPAHRGTAGAIPRSLEVFEASRCSPVVAPTVFVSSQSWASAVCPKQPLLLRLHRVPPMQHLRSFCLFLRWLWPSVLQPLSFGWDIHHSALLEIQRQHTASGSQVVAGTGSLLSVFSCLHKPSRDIALADHQIFLILSIQARQKCSDRPSNPAFLGEDFRCPSGSSNSRMDDDHRWSAYTRIALLPKCPLESSSPDQMATCAVQAT
mmetsp:Transcript_90020/g.197125  ORF Transcript_90020/g.197125 Transcript_90020/m.197125 type:complete len:211 (-) Transcript_90020:581-1213(-)